MHAIATGFHRQIRPIIHDEGRATLLHDGAQKIGGAQNYIVADVFEAQLHRCHIARIERGGQRVDESARIVEARRGD
jgi:hypothetical protein